MSLWVCLQTDVLVTVHCYTANSVIAIFVSLFSQTQSLLETQMINVCLLTDFWTGANKSWFRNPFVELCETHWCQLCLSRAQLSSVFGTFLKLRNSLLIASTIKLLTDEAWVVLTRWLERRYCSWLTSTGERASEWDIQVTSGHMNKCGF